jgi:hypothetical protein
MFLDLIPLFFALIFHSYVHLFVLYFSIENCLLSLIL